jgi:ribosomal protein S18 acetylase RimI-like enzyme
MLSIIKVEEEGEALQECIELFKEYFEELNENLCFQNFDEELEDPLKKYGKPEGVLLLAYYDDVSAGCIALQSIKSEGHVVNEVCEMKRLYVKPVFRKNKIGEELVKILLEEANSKDYKKMVLDTLERLQPAIKLYHRYGFKNTSAYYANPLPGVVFMAKELT